MNINTSSNIGFSLDSETRSQRGTFNPMCEVFPKVATCDYIRFGRLGGGQSSKNAICVLSLNIINDKVSSLHLSRSRH